MYSFLYGTSNVDYFFDDGVPTELRPFLEDSAQEWTAVPNANFTYAARGQTDDNRWDDDTCNLENDVVVSYGDHEAGEPDPNYGVTIACVWPDGRMHSARIRISDDYRGGNNPNGVDFYFGTGSPPSDRRDVQGTIEHEFGHATGRTGSAQDQGHFNDGDRACPGSDTNPGTGYATMCDTLGPGRTAWRSLESHDETALAGQY